MQKNFEKTDNNGKIMNDISQKESLSTSKKEKIGFEKYRTKSFVSKLSLYIKKFRFSEKELLMIKQRFNKMALNGYLTKFKFRESLGVLGLENASYLADRIFLTIDEDYNGLATFEEFANYMNILIKGDENEKALLSFRILDTGHKGKIVYSDIEKMLYGISLLWNSITGSKIIPKKSYIDHIFKTFDLKGNNEILFKDFLTVYKADPELFCWFEFLNQGDLNEDLLGISKKFLFSKKEDVKNNEISSFSNIRENNNEYLNKNLGEIEKEISKCIELIKEEDKMLKIKSMLQKTSPTSNQDSNPNGFVSLSKTNFSSSSEYTSGPSFFNAKMQRKSGDFSPNISFEKIDEKSKEEDSFMEEQTSSRFHANLLDTLKSLTKIAENLKMEINKNSFSSISIETLSQINTDKNSNNNNLNKHNRVKLLAKPKAISNNVSSLSKYQSPLKISVLPLPQALGSLRRVTMKNMPGTQQKKTKTNSPIKNLGIYFGHENWNLVMNMIIGIRTSIKSLYSVSDETLVESYEFSMKGHFELIQKRAAGFDMRKTSKFYDYAPSIFERIRKKFLISNDEYLRSIGPENLLGSIIMGNLASLTELMSSGKSGSFFYFTGDSKFMLKTVSKAEFSLCLKVLKNYYHHVINNENTMMTKIYGLHKIKLFKSKNQSEKLYFVIMANLFTTPLEIDVRYDLKGSKIGRTSRGKNKYWDKSIALKDLDFLLDEMTIELSREEKENMIKQLEKDVEFFQMNHIIDYSLLVGVHTITSESKQFFVSSSPEEKLQKKFYESFQGGLLSRDRKNIYFIGVIDILTEFSAKKKMEYGFKKTFMGKNISCIPPLEYGNRYMAFMKDHVFL